MVCYSIGFLVPLVATFLCAIFDGIPEKQTMMISVGRTQILIGNALILVMIVSVFVCLVVFSRAKNEHTSFFGIISTTSTSDSTRKLASNRNQRRTYALLAQDVAETADAVTSLNDPENGGLDTDGLLPPRRYSEDLKCRFFKFWSLKFDIFLIFCKITVARDLNETHQVTKQIALVIILTFDSFLVNINLKHNKQENTRKNLFILSLEDVLLQNVDSIRRGQEWPVL